MNTYNIRNLFSLICIIALSLFAISCGSDDDRSGIESTNDDLNGVWLATSFEQGGVELFPDLVTSLQLTFARTRIAGGTFTALATPTTGMGTPLNTTYTVVDDGNRIVIGNDTIDLTSSSTNLTLDGNTPFSSGQTMITATKQ